MAQVWMCDRCEQVSKLGNCDDPPDGWHTLEMPVRGSTGNESWSNRLFCDGCLDGLYEWLHDGVEMACGDEWHDSEEGTRDHDPGCEAPPDHLGPCFGNEHADDPPSTSVKGDRT